MLMILFKFLRALFPYLKESLFGKRPLPEYIYKHKVTWFFVFTTLFFLSCFVLFLDASFTIIKEKDQLKLTILEQEEKVKSLELEIATLSRDRSPEYYERTIKRLEEEVDRVLRENARYRLHIADLENNTVTP